MRKGRFEQYLNENCSKPEPLFFLPSTHTTDLFAFDSILETDSLMPKKCPVFTTDELVYYFYGRASYRTDQSRSSRLENGLPVVFLVKTETLAGLKRIFPFDTGAFSNNLFGEYFNDSSELADFELPPLLDSISKIVEHFYSGNSSYLDNNLNDDLCPKMFEFEAQGYIELAKNLPSKDGIVVDERCTAIELQSDSELQLNSSLSCVVLPHEYADHQRVKEAQIRWGGPVIITYRVSHNTNPEARVGVIAEKIKEYYSDMLGGC